jgi:hypothetical protein
MAVQGAPARSRNTPLRIFFDGAAAPRRLGRSSRGCYQVLPSMRWSLALVILAALLLPSACRRGPRPRITLQDVERCERGIDRAASEPTREQATATFYRECATTCAEPECQQAFLEASTAGLDQQVPLVLARCSKVYCPIFADRKIVACDPNFVKTPLTIAFGWAELHGRILERDASGYTPRLLRAFMMKDQALLKAPPAETTSPEPTATATDADATAP